MNSEVRIINKRIFGFCVALVVLFALACVWFLLDSKGLAIVCLLLALMQIAFIVMTPLYYLFSAETLHIQYLFGSEIIDWKTVKAVVNDHENAFRYTQLSTWRFFYYTEEKKPFFMQGTVSKNKKTSKALRTYAPRNLQHYFQ